MTPWLGAFVALAENQGSGLSSHNWNFIPRGPDIFLSLRAPGLCDSHAYMQATLIHVKQVTGK